MVGSGWLVPTQAALRERLAPGVPGSGDGKGLTRFSAARHSHFGSRWLAGLREAAAPLTSRHPPPACSRHSSPVRIPPSATRHRPHPTTHHPLARTTNHPPASHHPSPARIRRPSPVRIRHPGTGHPAPAVRSHPGIGTRRPLTSRHRHPPSARTPAVAGSVVSRRLPVRSRRVASGRVGSRRIVCTGRSGSRRGGDVFVASPAGPGAVPGTLLRCGGEDVAASSGHPGPRDTAGGGTGHRP